MTNRPSDKDPRQTWETIGEEEPYCGTGGPTRSDPKAGKFAEPDSGLFDFIEPNATVLDVGCGYGRNSIPIANAKKASVVACDISLSMSRSVRERVLPFILCDLRKLPFRDSSFDYLICSVVLIHLKRIEIDEAIAELKRVGRKCLIVMPNPVGRASLFGAIPLLVGPVMWIRKGMELAAFGLFRHSLSKRICRELLPAMDVPRSVGGSFRQCGRGLCENRQGSSPVYDRSSVIHLQQF